MKYSFFYLAIALLFVTCKSDESVVPDVLTKTTITFSSGDDLTITADTYIKKSNTQFILLCHQAGYSRGEYKDTAPLFTNKGYNCMAMDQRSGGSVNDVVNETHAAAVQKGLVTDYLSAETDIKAAIDKAYALNGDKPIYLLGSSYSSSWALLLGKTNPKVKATIAFSPRENLSGINITNDLEGYSKPVFVTSAQIETATTSSLVAKISDQQLTHFQSAKAGIHGARCLWSSTDGSAEYWAALEQFLSANN